MNSSSENNQTYLAEYWGKVGAFARVSGNVRGDVMRVLTTETSTWSTSTIGALIIQLGP